MSGGMAGRRLHLSGSAHVDDAGEDLTYAHALVRTITDHAARQGAAFTVQVVPEPRHDSGMPRVFTWTVMETIHDAITQGGADAQTQAGPIITAISTEKVLLEPPLHCHALWDALCDRDAVKLIRLPAGWNAGAVQREQAARQSDVLVTLGGGEGVEHLAELYRKRCKPVIPLDVPLKASCADGHLGGIGLARAAITNPARLFTLAGQGDPAARLQRLSHRTGPADQVGARVVQLLADLRPPTAFYVRLLNPAHDAYPAVERFFRQVVDPITNQLGYQRIEVGTDQATSAFVNIDIFRNLFTASAVLVDFTGLRNNCFLEAGLAFGSELPVVVTAQAGTPLPFDTQMIPTYFWTDDTHDEDRRAELLKHWRRVIARPSVQVELGLV